MTFIALLALCIGTVLGYHIAIGLRELKITTALAISNTATMAQGLQRVARMIEMSNTNSKKIGLTLDRLALNIASKP